MPIERNGKKISTAVIKRLPRYYRYLGEMLRNDINRISSKELSFRMHVTASQIRQDLNCFGGFGQQGYGYNVQNLYDEIGRILGIDKIYKMIIVGAGNLGQALANYSNFQNRGFILTGIFDVSPKLIGLKVRDIEIMDAGQLEQFVKDTGVDIAILCTPKEKTSKAAEDLAKWGVKGLLNFSPTDIQISADVETENVHLIDSLMILSYKFAQKKKLEAEGN
jgi:redox-sensing transcriptional repressor